MLPTCHVVTGHCQNSCALVGRRCGVNTEVTERGGGGRRRLRFGGGGFDGVASVGGGEGEGAGDGSGEGDGDGDWDGEGSILSRVEGCNGDMRKVKTGDHGRGSRLLGHEGGSVGGKCGIARVEGEKKNGGGRERAWS